MLNHSEVTVNTTVYHSQMSGSQGIVHPYVESLLSNDPPFVMPIFMLGEEWIELPCGHVQDVGIFVIRNDSGQEMTTLPTEAERDQIRQRKVEISFGKSPTPHIEVRPGCSHDVSPVNGDPKSIRIRCKRGQAKCWIMVLPR